MVSFIYSLSKLQNFDTEKPSLDSQTLVYDVLSHLTERINQIDLRGISNLTYALHTYQFKNPQTFNFNEFFTALEELIIQKISPVLN